MARVYNFSAGPATLPESVLRECANEMLDYHGCGMSVFEMSHRSTAYQEIFEDTEATLRRIAHIPDSYRVLFLQGGATLQFAGIPLNLMRTSHAGYVLTGHFAELAWNEAEKYGDAEVLASSKDTQYDRIPDLSHSAQRAKQDRLDYVYLCQNNTIFGTQFHELPDCDDVPLIADVSSCFLAEPLDISRYGLVYAGAQKNAGCAGVTVVIVRDDLLKDGPAYTYCPSYLDYQLQAKKRSMLNTPNTYGIYVCGKVYRWIEQMGGLTKMHERNAQKSQMLYDFLDQSSIFHGHAQPQSRSISNVTFRTADPMLDAEVVAGATQRGLIGIKGHRLVGGMRASVYNAVSHEGVAALVSYLQEFEATHTGSGATTNSL